MRVRFDIVIDSATAGDMNQLALVSMTPYVPCYVSSCMIEELNNILKENNERLKRRFIDANNLDRLVGEMDDEDDPNEDRRFR